MPVPWHLYESDITNLYITKNKTAQYTVDFLNNKHSINITPRQLKFKFGGLKKVNAGEWRVINHEIAKLSGLGKSYDVFIFGHRLDPERVKRENRRYLGNPSEDEILKADLGIETIGQHRIEIRQCITIQNATSPCESSSMGIDFNVDLSRDAPGNDNEPVETTDESFQVPRELTTISEEGSSTGFVLTSNASENASNDDVESMETVDGNFLAALEVEEIEANYNTPRLHTPTLPRFLSSTHFHSSPSTAQPMLNFCSSAQELVRVNSQQLLSQPPGGRSPFQNFIQSPQMGFLNTFNSTNFSYDNFWDSLAVSSVLLSLGCNSGISDDPQSRLESVNAAQATIHRGMEAYHAYQTNRRQVHLSSIEMQENFFREQQDLMLSKGAFDYQNMDIRLFFLVVIYLVSNNLVSSGRLQPLIESVLFAKAMIPENIIEFWEFLKLEFPHNKSPVQIILQAMCNSFPFPIKQRYNNQSLFEKYPSQSLQLLNKATQEDLSGSLGWNLLRTAVLADNLRAVKLLVERGVRVNQVRKRTDRGSETPLAAAARHGLVNILEFLIHSGADINQGFYRGDNKRWTALAVAVVAERYDTVSILLAAKAKVDLKLKFASQNILDISRDKMPNIHALLLKHLIANDDTKTALMVQAARKGTGQLADFLVGNDIMDDEFLERGLYYAVKTANIEAVGTFLRRGVDANARKYRLLVNGAFDDDAADDSICDDDASDDSICDDDASDDSTYDEDSETLHHPLIAAILIRDLRGTDIVHLLSRAKANLDEREASAVFSACRTRNDSSAFLSRFLALARAGQDMSILGPMALEYAADDDDGPIDQCGACLDAGCPINSYGVTGKSALQMAAENGDLGLVQYLMDRGADVNFPAHKNIPADATLHCRGRTALQNAAAYGHQDVLEYLLQAGADIHAPPAQGDKGTTVLEAAAKYMGKVWAKMGPKTTIFKRMLALGAPVNRPNGESGSLLHEIINGIGASYLKLVIGKGDILESLASYRPQALTSWYCGRKLTPLQFAASENNLEAVRILIDHGARVNASAASPVGFTALQAALSECSSDATMDGEAQIQIVELLLQHGAEVNAPPSPQRGGTALQEACSQIHPNVEIIQVLLNRGAEVNAAPAPIMGATALQYASMRGHIHIVKLLLEHHADPNIPAAVQDGRTAVEGAAEHGRADIVRLLLNHGAKPDKGTHFSRAIKLARRNEHWHIVKLLESHRSFCDLLQTMDIEAGPMIEPRHGWECGAAPSYG
ncbi:ankyrin repeat-containing domain protein [Mariannaea sp. PMI_226]|nr:ankyrin repeat-containing domain protein [Mariannaea sp. PMI_226]